MQKNGQWKVFEICFIFWCDYCSKNFVLQIISPPAQWTFCRPNTKSLSLKMMQQNSSWTLSGIYTSSAKPPSTEHCRVLYGTHPLLLMPSIEVSEKERTQHWAPGFWKTKSAAIEIRLTGGSAWIWQDVREPANVWGQGLRGLLEIWELSGRARGKPKDLHVSTWQSWFDYPRLLCDVRNSVRVCYVRLQKQTKLLSITLRWMPILDSKCLA